MVNNTMIMTNDDDDDDNLDGDFDDMIFFLEFSIKKINSTE